MKLTISTFIISIFSVGFFLIVFSLNVIAKDVSVDSKGNGDSISWHSDKKQVIEYYNNKECHNAWKTLWEWSKKGHEEAKFTLFFMMNPPPHMKQLHFPGNGGDRVSTINETTIMGVYASDYFFNSKIKEEYEEEYTHVALKLFEEVGFDKMKISKGFMQCLRGNNTEKCSNLAIESNLVPAFDKYAKSIDILVQNGFQATCE